MRSIIFISLALITVVAAFGQSSVQPQAVPSRRLVMRGDMYSPLSEIYLDLEASAGKTGDSVAMRICSTDPLPAAIIEAVVDPVGIGAELTSGTISGLKYSSNQGSHLAFARLPHHSSSLCPGRVLGCSAWGRVACCS